MPHPQPDGYLALPAGGEGQPVLVLHPWWGLNATIRSVCDRLAEAGYVAFAPDLYHGKVTDQIPEAEALSTALFSSSEQAQADVVAAAAYLSDLAGQPALAVIGFSLGAFFALDLSVRMPDLVRKVVVYYGTGPSDFSGSQAAYLGHFAENDPFEGEEEIANLEEALQRSGRAATIYHYPSTGHWFAEPDRADAYNEPAATLAWGRTLNFLRQPSPA
jgi:carboxymethylenebutenolidase